MKTQHTLTIKPIVLMIAFLSVISCFGQTVNNKKKQRSIYSNWISTDYLNCLKTELPCECEKTNDYFLLSLDTAKKMVLLYNGRANYEYNLYDFISVSPTHLEVYNKVYVPSLFRDSIIIVGQIKFQHDSLLFADASDKQTTFTFYATGDNDSYFKEHIKLLNAALAARGYGNLNKTLQSDSLKCFCNWELGGINLIFAHKRDWILERKDKELYIYEWVNRPIDKEDNLKIEKKLFKKLTW